MLQPLLRRRSVRLQLERTPVVPYASRQPLRGHSGSSQALAACRIIHAASYALVSHISPLTRSVEDAALMMNVIAQPDARDWYALPAEAHDYVAALGCTCKGLKIAYSEKLGLDDVSVAADVSTSGAKRYRCIPKLGRRRRTRRSPGHSCVPRSFSYYVGFVRGEDRQ